MGKEQKNLQAEKIKRIKRRKHALHYLLVYLACLLVAFVIWLSVRYSMRMEDTEPLTDGSENSMSAVNCAGGEELFYV